MYYHNRNSYEDEIDIREALKSHNKIAQSGKNSSVDLNVSLKDLLEAKKNCDIYYTQISLLNGQIKKINNDILAERSRNSLLQEQVRNLEGQVSNSRREINSLRDNLTKQDMKYRIEKAEWESSLMSSKGPVSEEYYEALNILAKKFNCDYIDDMLRDNNLLCPVCMEGTNNKYGSCNHTICMKCLSKVDRCPICRSTS